MSARTTTALCAFVLTVPTLPTFAAPVTYGQGAASVSVEAFANVTTGLADGDDSLNTRDGDVRFDGAVRLLGRLGIHSGPDLGARIVAQTSPEDELELAEASILIFGGAGRLEVGDRQGLPDVLLGYAPNNFTFTGAEFGPASGPSLDPGGGLQTAFLRRDLAAQLSDLTALGFTASLAADESAKLLYVSPKRRGFLAGFSYAPDATDPRFRDLVQFGLTHDTYWHDNVLHVGGSYSFARGAQPADGARVDDLHSVNLGATLVLHDDLQIGASVTYNGSSGNAIASSTAELSDALGAVASINYNRGPWTVGAYYQWAQSEGDAGTRANEVLHAAEAGVSYRTSTHLRFYGAYYYYQFDDDGSGPSANREDGGVLVLGIRVSL